MDYWQAAPFYPDLFMYYRGGINSQNWQVQQGSVYSGGWQCQQNPFGGSRYQQSTLGVWQYQQNPFGGWQVPSYQNPFEGRHLLGDYLVGWPNQQNQFGCAQLATSQANQSIGADWKVNGSQGQNLFVKSIPTSESMKHHQLTESNKSGLVVATTFLEPEVSREPDVSLVSYERNGNVEERQGHVDKENQLDAGAYTPNDDHNDNYDDQLIESSKIKPKYKLGCDNRGIIVKASGDSKKYCCPFCDKVLFNLPRHMQSKHVEEPDVQRFLRFSEGSKKRRVILDSLRNIGSLNFNKNAELNKNELFTSRRPKIEKSAEKYTTCPYCFAPLARSGLAYHVNHKCRHAPVFDERTDGERVTTSLATAVEARFHEHASPALQKVFSKLWNERYRGIKLDWLATVYGNKLASKYTKRNSPDMIANRMRLIARVLSALKNIEPNITHLAGLYVPKYYDRVVEAIRAVARVDTVRNEFIAPARASSAVTAIRQIGELLIVEYIKTDDQENQRITRDFLAVMNSDMHISINKMVTETQSRKSRQKTVTLPSSEDVKRLADYIETRRAECFFELSKSYSFKAWLQLTEFTMVSIIVFNRRRVGDTQNILDKDFTSKEVFNQDSNELLSILPKSSIEIANQYSRMRVRGKKNRTVPVLLKAEVENCLELIISHRQDAGISSENKFLFALPSKSDNSKVVNAGRI